MESIVLREKLADIIPYFYLYLGILRRRMRGAYENREATKYQSF